VSGSFNDTFFTLAQAGPPVLPQNWGYPKYKGLFNYKVNASIARVPDGTSNTMMFSEVSGGLFDTYTCGNCSAAITVGMGWNAGWSWAAGGSISTAFGTCPDKTNVNCIPNNAIVPPGPFPYDPNPAGLGLNGGLAASFHTGIFNVAFADGSVRPIRSPIDFVLLLQLGGFNDGEVINDLQ
jgi:prepilin-type processing-associated H-X9-DG protein